MSLLFCESFDVDTDPTFKWDVWAVGAPNVLYGKHDKGVFFNSTSVTRKRFSTVGEDHVILGLWINFPNAAGGTNNRNLLSLSAVAHSPGSTNPANGFLLFVSGDTLKANLYKGGGLLVSLSSSVALTRGSWQYLEISWDNSGQKFILKLDEVTGIDYTGSVGALANADVQYLQFGTNAVQTDSEFYADDINIISGDLTAPNDFLGPSRVDYLPVNVVGSEGDFAEVGGTAPDILNGSATMTDFINGGDGDREVYDLVDLSGPFAVHAVQMAALASLGGGTDYDLKAIVKSGLSEGGTDWRLLATAAVHSWIFSQDPNTSAPWNVSDLIAAEFGFEARITPP